MDDKKIIKVDIRQDDIEHTLTLGEFRDQLIAEIGSVTWIVSKKQFRDRVATSIDRVIQRIRDTR
jgi:hypothetical protein